MRGNETITILTLIGLSILGVFFYIPGEPMIDQWDQLSLAIDQVLIQNYMEDGCTLIEAYTKLVTQ